MDFEWRDDKSDRFLRERGFEFEFVVHVFDGPTLEFADNRTDYGEARTIAIGEIKGTIYKVVFSDREGGRRIISANRASRQKKGNGNRS